MSRPTNSRVKWKRRGLSLFVAMIVTLSLSATGFAFLPESASPGARWLCGSGRITHSVMTTGQSTMPVISCEDRATTGNAPKRRDITWNAILVSFSGYTLAMWFVVVPIAWIFGPRLHWRTRFQDLGR